MPQGDQKDLKAKIAQREKLLKLAKDHQKAEEAVTAAIEKQGKASDKLLKTAADAKKSLGDANKEAEKGSEDAKKSTEEQTKAVHDWADSLDKKLAKSIEQAKKQGTQFAHQTEIGNQILIEMGKNLDITNESGGDATRELIKGFVETSHQIDRVNAGLEEMSNDKLAELQKQQDKYAKQLKKDKKISDFGLKAMKDVQGISKANVKQHGKLVNEGKRWVKGLFKAEKLLKGALVVVAAMGAAMEKMAEAAERVQDALGTSASFSIKQAFSFRKMFHSMIGVRSGILSAKTELSLAASDMSFMSDESEHLALNMAWVAKNTGTSAKDLAEVQEILMLNTDMTREMANNMLIGMEKFVREAGGIPKEVFADIASSSEEIAKFSDGTADSLMRAATMANKLGINLKTAGTMADSLLNLEQSIASEFEASVLIGRDLNYDKARTLALNNNIEGAMKEIVSQLGSEEEFLAMNAIQRQAIADSIGVSVDDISKMVGYGAEGGGEVPEGLKIEKSSNKGIWDIVKLLTPGALKNVFALGTKGLLAAIGTLQAGKWGAKLLVKLGVQSNILASMAKWTWKTPFKGFFKLLKGLVYELPKWIWSQGANILQKIFSPFRTLSTNLKSLIPRKMLMNFKVNLLLIKDSLINLPKKMWDVGKGMFKGLSTFAQKIWKAITWLPRQIAKIKPLSFIKDTWKSISGLPGKIGAKIGNLKIFSTLGKFFSKSGPLLSVLGPLKAVFSKLSGWLAPLFDIFQTFFGKNEGDKEAGASGIAFGTAGAGIGAAIGSFFGGVGAIPGAAIGYAIGSVIGHITNSFLPAVGKTIVAWANTVGGWMKDAWSWVTDIGAGVAGAFAGAHDWVAENYSAAVENVNIGIDAVKAWNASYQQWKGDMRAAFVETWNKLGDSLLETIGNIWDAIWEPLAKLSDDITTKVQEIMSFDLGAWASRKWADADLMPSFFKKDKKKKVVDDFIWRPGQGLEEFSKDDTVFGTKGGGAGNDAFEKGKSRIEFQEMQTAMKAQIGVLQVIANKLAPLDVIARSNEDIKIEAQRNTTTLGK